MDRHAIQLVKVSVEELYVKILDQEKFNDPNYAKDFTLTVARSDYDAEEKIISVRLSMDFKPETDVIDRPFEMRVSVAGHFKVDEEKFPVEMVNKFAEINAPTILIPYIREHAYSLSLRIGPDPIIFPLVQVNVFRNEKKEEA